MYRGDGSDPRKIEFKRMTDELRLRDQDIERLGILVEQAKQRLKDMHLYSPMQAVVSEIHVNTGSYVEDGDPMILLHDPSDVWMRRTSTSRTSAT